MLRALVGALLLVLLDTAALAQARRDPGMPPGSVFMPFAFVEAAANLLTNPALDPFGKIPEFKYCAVRVAPAAVAVA